MAADEELFAFFLVFVYDLLIHLSIYTSAQQKGMMQIKRKSVFCI